MVVNNDYLVPHWDSLSKDGLKTSFIYVDDVRVYEILGFNSWSARLPSAYIRIFDCFVSLFDGEEVF